MNKNNFKKYFKGRKKIEHLLFKRIMFFLKDPFVNPIDVEYVISKIEKLIPEHLFHDIDMIIVGKNELFHKKSINAFYKDGAIYVTDEQKNEDDDIVHELAHSLEDRYNYNLYEDGFLEAEFLGKRKRLYYEIEEEKPSLISFYNSDYSYNFDMFLLKKLGYDKLTLYTVNLFHNPYAVTSLREYFATGFETYFLKSADSLKKLCPVLYTKILDLVEVGEEQ